MTNPDLPFDPPLASICGHCGKQLSVCERTQHCFALPVRYWRQDIERHETLDEAHARKEAQLMLRGKRAPTDAELAEVLLRIVRTLEPLTPGGRARVLLFVALQCGPHALPEEHLIELVRAGKKP